MEILGDKHILKIRKGKQSKPTQKHEDKKKKAQDKWQKAIDDAVARESY